MTKRETLTVADLLAASDKRPEDIADEAGVGRSTIYRWIAGESVPPNTRAAGIARALGLHVNYVRKAIANSQASPARSS